MRALSVFHGGFTADAAEQLIADGDVVQTLEQLVDQSLLKVTDTPSGTRFSMLETVREFSTARREAAGETDRVVDGRARDAAEQADRAAYDDAVSSYAALGRDELRAAALAVLRARDF